MNCNKKQKYISKHLADEYCEAYNNDILVNQTEYLCSYWCNLHRSWHIGHLKPMGFTITSARDNLIGLMDQIAKEETQGTDEGKSLG